MCRTAGMLARIGMKAHTQAMLSMELGEQQELLKQSSALFRQLIYER